MSINVNNVIITNYAYKIYDKCTKEDFLKNNKRANIMKTGEKRRNREITPLYIKKYQKMG